MDLAKIRQKSRLERENSRQDEQACPLAADDAITDSAGIHVPADRHIPDDDDFFDVAGGVPVASHVPVSSPEMPSARRAPKDPLEAILTGRALAGCDESMPDTAGEQGSGDVAEYQEFLCFRVSDEVYGINIMEIKELIRPREVTEVPRAPSFVSGVISLRGTIIPIIDMLDRLGLAREPLSGRERVIVVRQADSFCGLLVDEIIQVARIAIDNIESPPPVLEGIDRDFVSGIGRSGAQMVILLNLQNITDIHLY